MAPAGTIIENQAIAFVDDARYYSPVVYTRVLPVCRPSIVPDGSKEDPGQTVTTTPGGTAYLVYTAVNAGNDTFVFDLSDLVHADSEWSPAEVRFYLDTQPNSRVDPGEPEITTLELAPGDSAGLIVEIVAPTGTTGDMWITPVMTCPGGEEDDDNYALVSLRSGPALQLTKSFSKPELNPGDRVEVELRVRNIGDRETGDQVVVTDEFSDMPGVSYVPGSAAAAKGTVEYYDGASWSATEPDSVQGIRLILPGLEVGEEAYLTFTMEVEAGHAPGRIQNIATAEGPGGPAQSVASFDVRSVYLHYLGPKDNPRAEPGGEGSEDDRQEGVLIEGQAYCFAHTLENAGNIEDTYQLDYSGLPDGVTAQLWQTPGIPLTTPLKLGPGETYDFVLCLTANPGLAESGDSITPFTVTLTATSESTGEENHTYDVVKAIYPASDLDLTKSGEPNPVVAGGTLTYTLKAKNNNPFDLHEVVISDRLDDNLEFVESDPDAEFDPSQNRLVWRVPVLAAGEVWEATVTTRVKSGVEDGTVIDNEFTLSATELPSPVPSNEVETTVWSGGLQIQKQVSPEVVRVGDTLNYTLTLYNPSPKPIFVHLTDTPDPHLEYVPGSGKPWEPQVVDGVLDWGELTMAAGEVLVITYRMRVLPGIPEKFENVAVAEGKSESGVTVGRSTARAKSTVVERVFLRRTATLVGRVFLDSDRDGVYDQGSDLPLPGARVVLANGAQALTDIEGRYAFRDLEEGVWLVVLDPVSAPFKPLPHPEALGKGYSHRVSAYGLTVSDFPLEAPRGVISAVRRTRLEMGPLVVEKQLIPLGDGRYRVALHLSSTEPLPEFELRDPLPGGGERTFKYDVFEGERTITYEIPAPAWLTDPEVRWRYP